MKVLSLGAGVQSSTLLLMACKGEIEKPDVAIFADTGWESSVTYNHLAWLKGESERHGIPVIIVQEHNIRDDSLNASEMNKGFIYLPAHNIRLDGVCGINKRQCTNNYKITPIKHKVRELLGVHRGARLPAEAVEQWVGISIDEAQRMKLSRDRWIGLRYPLIERMMSRNDCILWLHNNYNGLKVPKSSCIGCPFHDNNAWRDLTETEFADACIVDDAIRSTRIKFTNYLHKKRIPLREVDLRTPEDKGQIPFEFYKQERITLFATTSPLWLPSV